MHGPPVYSGFLQGRQSKTFALNWKGPWLAAIKKMDGRGGRIRWKGGSFVQIILLLVKKEFQQKTGMPRVVQVRPCSAVILAQVCW